MSIVLSSNGELIGHAYPILFYVYQKKYNKLPVERESTDIVENNQEFFKYFQLTDKLSYATILNSTLNYNIDLPEFLRN